MIWRHMIGLQFQTVAWVMMGATQGQTDVWLAWYKLYRQALVFRGFAGSRLQAELAKVTEHQLL